ncbi:MAG: HD-GYP domain-containing protein [Thermacetogeniaceae bacterium]|nr:HD domain-containing protein [Thermoanaerobacterales bacterium]NLN20846.1 HD domain-containing protein [Syntrophomonadaceae bacterium]
MRRMGLKWLQPGMVLERPVYGKGGRILLDKGITLKESYIRRLADFGVSHVYVYDERLAEIIIDDVVNEETRLEAAEIVKEAVDNIRFGKELKAEVIKQAVTEIIDEILDNRDALFHLSELRIAGENLFHHSVTVTIYSILTGLTINYHKEDLLKLGTGALLHDIGKSRIPEWIGPGYEAMKNHTVYGFEILRRDRDFSLLEAHVAYQHHELFDGSGYPRQLKGRNIHEFARITAIANTYDALVTGLYEKKLLPYQAIEYITAQAGGAFDPELARVFSTNIVVYPLGSLVRLNTGDKGFVVKIPKNYPTRPVVRIIKDSMQRKYRKNFPEIDLMKELTVFIEDVIEE